MKKGIKVLLNTTTEKTTEVGMGKVLDYFFLKMNKKKPKKKPSQIKPVATT